MASTPEYVTFRKNYTKLVSIVAADHDAICDALFEKGYISPDVRDHTRNATYTSQDKARKLVDSIIDRISLRPEVFHGFLEVLDTPHNKDFADSLRQSYESKLEPGLDEVERSSSYDSCAEDENFGFVCPYCRNCKVEQFFSEEGCPQKKRVTDLNALTPSESNGDAFKMHMVDTRNIITSFSNFVVCIQKSFKDRLKSFKIVRDTVLSLEAFTDSTDVKVVEPCDAKKLKAAISIEDVFIILRYYMSFFNYHIIEHLIDCHGSDDDKKRFELYFIAFKTFCKKSIVNPPLNVFCNFPETNATKLVIKCTHSIATLEDAHTIKEKVACVFELQAFALQLFSVKSGCVELHFFISAAVANHIFPRSPSQNSALSEIGISCSVFNDNQSYEQAVSL